MLYHPINFAAIGFGAGRGRDDVNFVAALAHPHGEVAGESSRPGNIGGIGVGGIDDFHEGPF